MYRAHELPGDLNGDRIVGIDDLNAVLGNWNASLPDPAIVGDLTGDGFVGIDDLNLVLTHWNHGAPPSGEQVSTLIQIVSASASGDPPATVTHSTKLQSATNQNQASFDAQTRLAIRSWAQCQEQPGDFDSTEPPVGPLGLWEETVSFNQ